MTVVDTFREDLKPDVRERLHRIGLRGESHHAGTAVVVDQGVPVALESNPDVEVLPLAEALRRHPWVQDLMFGLIDAEENEQIRQVTERTQDPVGYFVHVLPGAKVSLPVQLFTLLGRPQGRQYLHSVIVVDEDAELEIISGSTVSPDVRAGRHISISETYLRRGAKCRSVSVEQWGDDMEVYDYSRSHIGPGASEVSTSIMLSHVRCYHTEGKVVIDEGGSSQDQAVMFSPAGTDRVVTSDYVLAGDDASAESIARMVTAGGTMTNRSTLIGDGRRSTGYLGCDGLKLTEEGQILSAPALVANSASAVLSHEASIGVIGEDKVAYLQASGLDEDDARNLLIQGFLDLDEDLVPEAIRDDVAEMVQIAKSGAL